MNYLRAAILLAFFGVAGTSTAEETKVTFRKVQLDAKFRSEGTCVADFSGDGRPDISAGSVYYAAPDWRMVAVQEKPQEYDPKSYSRSFQNFSDDLNGDGRPDLIIVEWPGEQTVWYENPGEEGKPWSAKHLLASVTNNEGPQLLDIDGDGERELIAAHSPDPKNPDHAERRMAIFRRTKDHRAPWEVEAISAAGAPSTTRYAHGLGIGDINGDERLDIIVPQGWWESPAAANKTEWRFHEAPFGENASNMHVADFDGDGDADVLGTSPHAYGIWWYEQMKDGWKQHTIDKSFSQTHSVTLADINRDGLPDFVTGKRWWAHPSGDPGVNEPAVLVWYELKRGQDGPKWIAHEIDHDSGVGTQHQTADVNGDGLLDIVIANKKGVFYFEQVGSKPAAP